MGFMPGGAGSSLASARLTDVGEDLEPSANQQYTGSFSGPVNGIPFGTQAPSANGNAGFYSGVGVPTFSAMNGSMYVRTDSTTVGARWYVNTSGANTVGTSWTALAAP